MKSESKKLPDVTESKKSFHRFPLDRVGMNNVEMPVQVCLDDMVFFLPSRANILVDIIDRDVKGIHMSRLYLLVYQWFQQNQFDLYLLKDLLNRIIESQKGISSTSHLILKFDLPLKKKSLLSSNEGYRYYPVIFDLLGHSDQKVRFRVHLKLTYSSTCPCSAALSRQLIRDQFENDFNDQSQPDKLAVMTWLDDEKSQAGLPHAQRSIAGFDLSLACEKENLSGMGWLVSLIQQLEGQIKTPVQTAVKREDEQEFARLNGGNLIFCEDAARLFKNYLEQKEEIIDYKIVISHLESLHAHDATAISVKGIPDGFRV